MTRADMHGIDGSYPSGHQAAVVVTAGTLVVVARWQGARWWRAATVVGGPAVVMATALLVTGTHWCTDVLGGTLLGLAVLGTVAMVRLVGGQAGATEPRDGRLRPVPACARGGR